MMVLYSPLDAASELIGLASIVTVIVWLISSLQPLFERVRDSCRARQPPEGRAQLLWSAFLIFVAGIAAAVLYLRILFSLWDVMGAWLDDQPFNRPVYALLHFYLLFLLVCGVYACAITIGKVPETHKVLSDLWVMTRFNRGKYEVVEDVEGHHCPSSPALFSPQTEVAAVVDGVQYTSSLPQDKNTCKNDQELNEGVALSRACTNESEHPMSEPAWSRIQHVLKETMTRTLYSPIR